MRNTPVLLSLCWLFLLGCLADCAPAFATGIEFDGRQRQFEMAVPATAPRPLPVVLVLHGGGGTSEQIRRYSHFDDIAQSQGVLVVYPQAVGRHWNDGRGAVGGALHPVEEADDVAFLIAVVDTLARTGLADPHRVYVTGISNGAMMALRLACELPERIAAVAAVAGNMPEGLDCTPSRPVPMMLFHGTADRYIPYDGGDVLQWANIDRGRVRSVADTVELWRKINGCVEEPEQEVASRSATLVSERFTYPSCSGAPLVQYITKGGGHVWPGAHQGPGGDALLGAVDRQLDASAVMWEFFKSQPNR